MNTVIHTLHDASHLATMKASALIEVPVWQGNRIIDHVHVRRIGDAIDGNVRMLDFGYRLVRCPVVDAGGAVVPTLFLVDGQHRHAVLRNHFQTHLCSDDFDVVVLIKDVSTEMDIIEYFNTLNTVKPILWTDPNLVVNEYISRLEAEFNRGKSVFLRKGSTCRPYLSVDKLREQLLARASRLSTSRAQIAAFVARVREWNEERVKEADLEMLTLTEKAGEQLERAAKLGFLLARDVRMRWIDACI
jgi:hypothetical protein